jgi:hypothetical protein
MKKILPFCLQYRNNVVILKFGNDKRHSILCQASYRTSREISSCEACSFVAAANGKANRYGAGARGRRSPDVTITEWSA